MADLTDLQAAGSTKIVGSDNTGLEQTAVQSTSAGGLHVNLRNNAGTELATTANPAIVAGPGVAGTPAGGVLSIQGVAGGTAVPTSASNFPTTVDTNYGTVGASTLRTASQIGNATGAALFGAGTTTAQVLRVVLPTDQTVIPVSMPDVSPANGTITAFDTATTTLVGANGQTFYTGTPTTNSAAVFSLSSIETVSVQGNLLGAGGTMNVEVSYDGGTFWFRPNVLQVSTQSYTNSFTAPFMVTVNVTNATQIRVRATVSWTGTATIIVKESVNTRNVTVADALPPGANVIGSVTASEDKNYGAVGANTLRTASQIGNATGSALFGAGTTTAQVLRVVLPTDQTAIPVTQSGAWTTGRTWTLASGTDSVAAVQSGTWTVQQGTPPWSVAGNVAAGAADSGNPVKIGGVFNSTAPTLTNGQRGDLQLDAKGRLTALDIANLGTGVQGAITVTTTATEVRVGGARLANRSSVTAFNNGAQTIFWGYTSGVTTTSGTPLVQNQVGSWKVGDQQSIYLIATSGSQNVRVTEV